MKREPGFKPFLAAYPPVPGQTRKLDGVSLAEAVEEHFHVAVPDVLQLFWLQVGAGSFGDGELYFFGDAASELAGPEVIAWNSAEWWRRVYPTPEKGAPFFFAQTAFGAQLGYRWQAKVAVPELLIPDTMEVFVLGRDVDELLGELLVARGALCDAERLARAYQHCGVLPVGHHYVPDVSPLRGGNDDLFHVATAEGHVEAAITDWEMVQARTRSAGAIGTRVNARQG